MQGLRKSGGAEALSQSELRLRGQVYQDLRRTKRAAMKSGSYAVRTVKYSHAAVNAIRRALVNNDSKAMLKYFTEEEVKRWESLSVSQQRSILRKAEKSLENGQHRIGAMTSSSMSTGAPTGELQENDLMDPSIIQSTYSYGSATGNKEFAAYIQNRNTTMAAYANRFASEKLPYRFEVDTIPGKTLREVRYAKKHGIVETRVFYSQNEKKGVRKTLKMEKTYRTAEKREAFKNAKIFRKQLGTDIRKAAEKNRQMEAMRRQQKIELVEYENAQNKAILQNASLPLRTVTKYGVKRVLSKAAQAIKSVVISLIPGFLKTAFITLAGGIAILIVIFGIIAVLVTGMTDNKRSLGTWRLTGYCDTPEDQGPYVGQTGSGLPLVAGRTVAVSKATMERLGLKFGDRLQLDDGRIFVIEDWGGSAMHNKLWVDIFCATEEEEYSERNNRYAEVFLLDPDGGIGFNLLGGGGNDITAFAEQYVGCPYVWGGSSLTNGCDCSHFVWLVLMNTGHYSGEYLTSYYWRTAGEPVSSLEQAQAGDVICYNGHVALYDGNGGIIEAKGSQWGITHDRTADHAPILAIRRFT